MMKNSEKTMDKIIALCKNRGFVFAGSEIYGGLANSWDYGPLGLEFKNKKYLTDKNKRFADFCEKHGTVCNFEYKRASDLGKSISCLLLHI